MTDRNRRGKKNPQSCVATACAPAVAAVTDGSMAAVLAGWHNSPDWRQEVDVLPSARRKHRTSNNRSDDESQSGSKNKPFQNKSRISTKTEQKRALVYGKNLLYKQSSFIGYVTFEGDGKKKKHKPVLKTLKLKYH